MQEELSGLRKEIDACDDIIVNTFIKRMKIAGRISEYKKANNIETLDKKREYDLKQRVLQSTDDDFKCYMSELFDKILELSKKYQEELRKNS
jgi:chorismate mutase